MSLLIWILLPRVDKMSKCVFLVILIAIIFPVSVPIRISFIPYYKLIDKRFNNTTGISPLDGIVKIKTYPEGGWVFNCEADLPIQWNITGFVKNPHLVQIHLYKRMWKGGREGSPTFTIRARILFEKIKQDADPLAASASCESIANPLVQETVLIFVSGNRTVPFVQSNISVLNRKTIPCATREPDFPVKLYKVLANHTKVQVEQSSPYHPVFGFSFNHLVEGKYICAARYRHRDPNDQLVYREATTSITATIEHFKNISQANPEYQMEPRTRLVYTYWSAWTTLTCRSSNVNQPVSITIDKPDADEYLFSWRSISDTLLTKRSSSGIFNSTFEASIQFHCAKCNHSNDVDQPSSLYISCLNANNKQIWRWEVIFADLDMRLDNYNRETICSFSLRGKGQLRAVPCSNSNPSQCEWMKQQCFNSDTDDFVDCNSRLEKLEFTKEDYVCYQGKRCNSLKFSALHGITQCRVGSLSKEIMFYTTLDNLKKNVMDPVQSSELIHMDPVSNVQYTNVTSYFFCRAVSFFFFENLAFQIELVNGSTILLEVPSAVGKEHPRKIKDGNLIAELNTSLPLDAVAMRCLAGWWNSSESAFAEQRFKTFHQLAPQMLMTNVNQTIILSTINSRLNCSAFAERPASYVWTKGSQALVTGENYKITVGEQGESLFLFEKLDANLTGEYICTASNQFGSQQAIFHVKNVLMEEDSGSRINMAYIFGATVALLVILLGICCRQRRIRAKQKRLARKQSEVKDSKQGNPSLLYAMLLAIFCMQRRIRAKQKRLARKLTEGEIKDFKEGNPSLLKSSEPNNSQHLHLLPFKPEHEIDFNDLKFDSSKLLGSGAYGTVVSGTWKSKGNKALAVKMSKPTVDMNVFNALLLEVKIMSYLEKHENVVTFYGACISDIENRNIYIVLELCPNGSIENILKSSNSKFVNLIMDDDNEAINTNLPSSYSQSFPEDFSTLDLIRWAAEIARGMEYLSFKGVVHADLATRNILLTLDGIVKISDFGLSRQLYAEADYVKKTKCPLPWRWMALESLKQLTFSSQSDVWSYGITVWEIFTMGDKPFPNETWNTEFVKRITQGLRPAKPKYANSQIYAQLIDCWEINPNLRPQFTTLANYFMELYTKYRNHLHNAQYTDLDEGNCNLTQVSEA